MRFKRRKPCGCVESVYRNGNGDERIASIIRCAPHQEEFIKEKAIEDERKEVRALNEKAARLLIGGLLDSVNRVAKKKAGVKLLSEC
jgi:hypothetical protein